MSLEDCGRVTFAPVRAQRAWRAAATIVALTLLFPDGASAAGDPRAERERARRGRAQAAAELDVLRAEEAKVDSALDALEEQAAVATQALRDAETAVAEAESAAAAAAAAEEQAAGLVRDRQQLLVDIAIEEFISGGGTPLTTTSLADNPVDRSRRASLTEIAVGTTASAEDQLQAAHEDLAVARDEARDAAAAARERATRVAERAEQAVAARDAQAAFAERLDARIESRLAEAAALADVDRRLSAQIARQQAAVASRAPSARSSSRTFSSGSVPLRTVRGITVHADIADALERMIDAAAADGIDLGGGGYRDPAAQQRLREQNCPDPQRSPARDCRPPTARPGYSMHEQGKAIDFTSDGRLIQSRSSTAFRWLSGNAGSYGFRNLPEEPWHWSTNGN